VGQLFFLLLDVADLDLGLEIIGLPEVLFDSLLFCLLQLLNRWRPSVSLMNKFLPLFADKT
jgi:hypothetical protein